MIRTLLATTALATVLALPATAQEAQPLETPMASSSVMPAASFDMSTGYTLVDTDRLASHIMGQPVYDGPAGDANNLGNINDLVLDANGDVQAVVIGVGGFLGIGQKDVAIEYNLAKWEERDNDRWLVVDTTADALKAQPEFDKQAYRPMPADANVAETKPATAEDLAKAPVNQAAAEQRPADSNQVAVVPAAPQTAAPADQTAQAPAATNNATDNTQTAAIDRSTLKERPIDQIRADDFVGTTIYGADDAKVGEVGDVVLSQDGKVDAVLVDVGGFLGIGGKEVALGMDNLRFMTDENGKLYLYTSLTKDALEAQPAYEKGSYADNRDKMRMNVPAAN